jgi:alcohol dehydrogenase class IV
VILKPFAIARLPRIEFGTGSLARLPDLIQGLGRRVLLVTGHQSLQQSTSWEPLVGALESRGLHWEHTKVRGEPSPELVDEAVKALAGSAVEVVVGIGGGSVLDAAKAMAGLLPSGRSVMDFLEGVGPERPFQGPALPYIAVPTTAGTGSEATKNAVLSRSGPRGFKKSFRHELLVPQYALVDPNLLATCPRELIAANGMDALTQLIEAFVSVRANPFTDALILSAVVAARDGLLSWYEDAYRAAEGREAMAYAALISGIALAQTGLGSVHGLASPLGALFPIPHGVVCGTLVAAATAMNIRAMRSREPENPALEKYAQLGNLLAAREHGSREEAWAALTRVLSDWTERLGLARLGVYGVHEHDLDRVVADSRGSSMKTNPIVLRDEEIRDLVAERL